MNEPVVRISAVADIIYNTYQAHYLTYMIPDYIIYNINIQHLI